VATAETWKSATLGENNRWNKTVKALAFGAARRALWDERGCPETGSGGSLSRLANGPQTLVTPSSEILLLGTTMLGAYLARNDPNG